MSDASISEFDRDTAVRRLSPGEYATDLSARWSFGQVLNGGYLLGAIGRALADALPHGDPFTISAHYLTATASGPAVIRTDTARTGRSLSTGSASLVQTDENGIEVERIRALATYGDLDSLTGEVRTTAKPPHMPSYEECVSTNDAPDPSLIPEFARRFAMRFDPATVGWAVGAPSGSGEMRAWFAFADGRESDPLSLLLTVDALPPTAFELGVTGWVPTVELTAHVRARPAPGPLRVALTTRNMAGGYLEEDAEVWDSTDRLVAQARQLARAPH
ncbi:thioesterase family protein [Streptomyces armeniacus]|uniref:Thioesterase family protein n=1 Tax=Streptomyces armeniacus TaxID=83291 RepID=A0A345XRS8_9ACTN|nr:thioesterase family protein [Streptomyces armeniacus]AXK34344.1 thioesterase family protein [Streptomyces armeniacus]